MALTALCPGYFERDVQQIIEKNGINFCKYYCALCGCQVVPARKDGGWVPKSHIAPSGTKR
jgi:hypothetical protein